MAQTVCVLLDDATMYQLAGIAGDRSRPLKHILRARIVLLSAERLTVQEAARQAGVSRPAVWRWQQRFAEEGVEGMLRDKTRPPGTPPHATRTRAEVLALTCSEPPDEVTHWTGRAVAKRIGISLRSVQRIWRKQVCVGEVVSEMDPQNAEAAGLVGRRDQELPVEPPRPQQCRVDPVDVIGRTDQDQSGERVPGCQ